MSIDRSVYRIAEAFYVIAQELHNLAEELRPPPPPEEESARVARVRALSIEGCEAPTRLVNALRAVGIETIGDAVERTEVDISRIPNIGRRSVNELKDILQNYGLSLKPGNEWTMRGFFSTKLNARAEN